MFTVQLLAAGVWEWIVPAVFIIIYLLNHLLSAGKGAGKQQRRQQQPAERPLAPKQPPAQAQLNSEIEQFLKRANERRMDKARRETQPPPSQPAAKPRPLAPPPEQAVDVEPLPNRDFDTVAASVQQHLGSRKFEQRAEHLADDIVQHEDDMERHLQQAFSHRLGTLSREESAAPALNVTDVEPARDDRAATAKAVAGLLANQQIIKQAIVLKEILERPVDRW